MPFSSFPITIEAEQDRGGDGCGFNTKDTGAKAKSSPADLHCSIHLGLGEATLGTNQYHFACHRR